MLGVGDAISPDFCLTIPRHWARSLVARGIEPLGRTFFVRVFKQRKDSSMFASSNQLRFSCTATDLNENFYQYIHRATNLTTNKASTTSKICFWFCTIRINVSSQPFV